jgi:hypothetical protein
MFVPGDAHQDAGLAPSVQTIFHTEAAVGRPALRLPVWAGRPGTEGEVVLTVVGVLAILLGIGCTVGLFLLSGQTPGRRRKGQLGYFSVGGSAAFALGNVAPVIPAPNTPLGQQAGLGTLPTVDLSRAKELRRVQLAPDATVTFAAVRKAAAIDDVFAALDRELVGLAPVKKRVREIGSLLLVDQVRHQFGLVAPRPNASPDHQAPGRPPWGCLWPTCCTDWATWNMGTSCTRCVTT